MFKYLLKDQIRHQMYVQKNLQSSEFIRTNVDQHLLKYLPQKCSRLRYSHWQKQLMPKLKTFARSMLKKVFRNPRQCLPYQIPMYVVPKFVKSMRAILMFLYQYLSNQRLTYHAARIQLVFATPKYCHYNMDHTNLCHLVFDKIWHTDR